MKRVAPLPPVFWVVGTCVLWGLGCGDSGSSPVPYVQAGGDAGVRVDAALGEDAAPSQTPPFHFLGLSTDQDEALRHALMRLSACGGVADLNQALSRHAFATDLSTTPFTVQALTRVPSPTDPTRFEPLEVDVEVFGFADKIPCVNAASGCEAIMACVGADLSQRCHIYEDTGCQGSKLVYCLDTTPRENLLAADEGHVRFERDCAANPAPNHACAPDPFSHQATCVAEVGVADCAAHVDCQGDLTPDCAGGVLRYRDCASIDQICEAGACVLGPDSLCAGYPSEIYGNDVTLCDGDRLIECVHPSLWGEVGETRCADFNMSCLTVHDDLLNADFYRCGPSDLACDEKIDGRSCNSTRVELCIKGTKVHVDCAEIDGRCDKNSAGISACAF